MLSTPLDHATFSSRPAPVRAYLHPLAMARGIWKHRALLLQFAQRELAARYKGQQLGLLWAVLTPLMMLGIYTFAFAVVFKTYWRAPDEPKGEFALAVFGSLLVFSVFRECVLRAPGAVIGNRNFVKRVVFPLEILAPADVLVALANMAIGLLVWLVGWVVLTRSLPHPHVALVPLLMTPVVLATLGVSWILSSLGAFLRDIANMVELGVTVLFFLTPIFYSLDRVPAPVRPILAANPLAATVEEIRRVMMLGVWPDWQWLGLCLAVSAATALLGYAFFMKSKRAFADVV